MVILLAKNWGICQQGGLPPLTAGLHMIVRESSATIPRVRSPSCYRRNPNRWRQETRRMRRVFSLYVRGQRDLREATPEVPRRSLWNIRDRVVGPTPSIRCLERITNPSVSFTESMPTTGCQRACTPLATIRRAESSSVARRTVPKSNRASPRPHSQEMGGVSEGW